jgi:hypothetical protein
MPLNIPTHYLVEDDSLIDGISIRTDRLLLPKNRNPNHALLLIEVTVRVVDMNVYNLNVLAD